MNRVLTTGCYDLLHFGHVRHLQYCAQFGRVIVALDSDERVRNRKGPGRPIVKECERFMIVDTIRWVSEVRLYTTDWQLLDIITDVRPTHFVVGDDYRQKPILGRELLDAMGCQIEFTPRTPHSTTDSLARIREAVQ